MKKPRPTESRMRQLLKEAANEDHRQRVKPFSVKAYRPVVEKLRAKGFSWNQLTKWFHERGVVYCLQTWYDTFRTIEKGPIKTVVTEFPRAKATGRRRATR